jgi:hypothetical protein
MVNVGIQYDPTTGKSGADVETPYRLDSAVCSDGWNYEDAYVACRQLGFPGVLQYYLGSPDPSTDFINDTYVNK